MSGSNELLDALNGRFLACSPQQLRGRLLFVVNNASLTCRIHVDFKVRWVDDRWLRLVLPRDDHACWQLIACIEHLIVVYVFAGGALDNEIHLILLPPWVFIVSRIEAHWCLGILEMTWTCLNRSFHQYLSLSIGCHHAVLANKPWRELYLSWSAQLVNTPAVGAVLGCLRLFHRVKVRWIAHFERKSTLRCIVVFSNLIGCVVIDLNVSPLLLTSRDLILAARS